MPSSIAICDFKLELQPGNTQFRSKLSIFWPVWPWHISAPFLCHCKLSALFHSHMFKQELQSRNARIGAKFVLTSVSLTFDLQPWHFAWTSLLSMAIINRWTDRSVLRTAWSQLKRYNISDNYVISMAWCKTAVTPQPPIQLTILASISHNSNSMYISFCSHRSFNIVINMKFCIWHNSSAVVAYAKFCSDMLLYKGVTLKPLFHRIWIMMEQSFMKWPPDHPSRVVLILQWYSQS